MRNGLILPPDGSKHWYLNDKLYCSEYFHGKFWYNEDGGYHREDGPACEYSNGVKLWFYNNKQIKASSNEEFLRMVKLKAFW